MLPFLYVFIIIIFLNIKGEKFDTSIACTQHNKKVHTENKPYKCGTCDRTFKRKFSMRRHEISHTGIKPYHCEFCEISFT